MKRIGLLSDTHGVLDERVFEHFKTCDEVWHAGDIGSNEVANQLEAFKPLRAVYGNIDSYDIRLRYPEYNRFVLEGVDVLMTHIAGYPGHYAQSIRPVLFNTPPKLLVCGHSHILRVMYDKWLKTLVVNPGAAGTYGQQAIQTLIRFVLKEGAICDLEVIELGHPQRRN